MKAPFEWNPIWRAVEKKGTRQQIGSSKKMKWKAEEPILNLIVGHINRDSILHMQGKTWI